jgi:nitroreductase
MSQPVYETLLSRRTTYEFLAESLTKQEIEHCLNAAVWAPNHKLTQPWRFWVCGEQTQHLLADVYADLRASKQAEKGSELYQSRFHKALQKFKAIPQVILVGQVVNSDPVIAKEDYAACACAIQNFQLAAWEIGIGVQWSTGPILRDSRTHELYQAQEAELKARVEQPLEWVGALYCGHPAKVPASQRKPLQEVTIFSS